MVAIDVNSDLGESYGIWQLGDDDAMLEIVTSANVACGFHAGDPSVLRAACTRAVECDVAIGAPSVTAAWLDRDGRVMWIFTTRVRQLSPTGDAVKELGPGGIADFYLIVDDPDIGPQLLGPTSEVSGIIIWGYGE